MAILLPNVSVKIRMENHPGFYFDIELVESPDGMVFAGWLYHIDFSIKSHIYSIEAIRDNDLLDWVTVAIQMDAYIEENNLINRYWEEIEILEEE